MSYRYEIVCETCGLGENDTAMFLVFRLKHDARHALREGERFLTDDEKVLWGKCPTCREIGPCVVGFHSVTVTAPSGIWAHRARIEAASRVRVREEA